MIKYGVMQPEQPYVSPGPAQPPTPTSSPENPQPNYDFLYSQPKRSLKLPLVGNSLAGKILVGLVCLLLIVVLFIIIKGIVSPSSFNQSDYYVLVERQNEILHILTIDVTQQNVGLLSPADQNIAATSKLSIQTALTKTLIFLNDYGDKVNTSKLATVYSNSIDQTLTSSLSTNSFDSTFNSLMKSQLNYYEQDLKTAYATTTISSGKALLRAEYSEAKLLYSGLSSPSS